MGILSSIFRTKSHSAELQKADRAIQLGRAGKITPAEMLAELLRGQVLIPLANTPELAGDRLVSWNPATVSKSDGHQFLLAFSDGAVHDAFVKQTPAYSYAFLANARWVIGVLPAGHGMLFNAGGDNVFEWSASGIANYVQHVRGDA
jgi:hypothetical protein